MSFRRGLRGRPVLAVLLAGLMAWAAFGVASAHANLARSDPPAGASLATSPAKVQLWFTEALEPSFSTAVVYDSNQQRVDQNDCHVDPSDPASLILTLKPNLPRGTYAIAWKTQSRVDGHVVRGIIPFGVGVASAPVGVAAPEGVSEGEVSGSPIEMGLRWLMLLGTTGLVGAAWFWRMQDGVSRSRADGGGEAGPLGSPGKGGGGPIPGQRTATIFAAALFLVAVFLLLLDNAAISANTSILGAIGAPVVQLAGETQYGRLLLARVILGVALLMVYLQWDRGRLGPARVDVVAFAVGALLLLATSLSSHSAAIGSFSPLTIANDWLHLAATTVWVGGLLQLAVLVPTLLATRGPGGGGPPGNGGPLPAGSGNRLHPAVPGSAHEPTARPMVLPAHATSPQSPATSLPAGPTTLPADSTGGPGSRMPAPAPASGPATARPAGVPVAETGVGPGPIAGGFRSANAGDSLRLLGAVVHRFGQVGAVALAILGVTGLIEAYVHVGTLDNLTNTDYGQALLVKVLLILPLFVLAAINHFVFRPTFSLARSATSTAFLAQVRDLARAFVWTVRLEIVFAVAVIAAVGVMTSLSPARQFGQATTGPLTLNAPAGDLSTVFNLTPGTPGPNQYVVDVRDRSGQAPSGIERVSVRLTYLDQDLGTNEVVLTRASPGRYVGQSSDLAVAGRWQADVVVRQSGQPDVTARYGFSLTDSGAQSIGDVPIQVSPQFYLGLGLAVIGVLALVRGRQLREDLRRAAVLAVCGVGLIGAGGYVSFQDVQTAQAQAAAATVALRHPPTAQSIANGALVYRQNCAVCHGPDARGDGPMAPSLNPRPSDLILHVPLHPDADLEYWISYGFPGSAMPAFQDKLSEDQRWDVLNYLKSLVSQGNGGTAASTASGASTTPSVASSGAPTAASGGAAPPATTPSGAATAPAATPAITTATSSTNATIAAPTGAASAAPATPTALPTPRPTPPGGGLSQTGAIGDLTAQLQIRPQIYQPAQFQVRLIDSRGQPATDVRRVDFQVAMEGMDHGARGIAATANGPGVYQARGLLLAMEGPWWLAVRVERAGGRIDSAVFAFQVPRQNPTGPVNAMEDRPNTTPQVVDVAVYPNELAPQEIAVRKGQALRLEVMEVDHPACNQSVHFDALHAVAPVSADGLAELVVTPDRTGTLRLTCGSSALALEYTPSP